MQQITKVNYRRMIKFFFLICHYYLLNKLIHLSNHVVYSTHLNTSELVINSKTNYCEVLVHKNTMIQTANATFTLKNLVSVSSILSYKPHELS